MTSVTFDGTVVAGAVSFFLANMPTNNILKYFWNNSYFTKLKERATKLNILLNEERTFWTIAFYVPFLKRSNVPIIYCVTNVRKMSGTFDILLQKGKNVWKTTWFRTHKGSETPTELKSCLGNNIYLLRFQKYDAEKHSFQCHSKRISRIQDELETWGRRNTWMSPSGKQPLLCFFY